MVGASGRKARKAKEAPSHSCCHLSRCNNRLHQSAHLLNKIRHTADFFIISRIIVATMNPGFLVFGQLTREYLLPPAGLPRLDAAGGSLLYAAAGLGVWEKSIGLVGRVGNDYPREWLN